VRGFRKKIFASKRNETKRDPFRMRFARSSEKIFFFLLLFASNFSLPTKAKLRQHIFALFRFLSDSDQPLFGLAFGRFGQVHVDLGGPLPVSHR
jgi:hypothetical protein